MRERLADILVRAGKLLLQRRADGNFGFTRAGAVVNASVDKEMHTFLLRELTGLTPGIPVLSEEDTTGRTGTRPSRYWLVDPLDGTASFVDGFSGFVTQAALIENRRPVVACIYAPALDELFQAETGAGATRNGEFIRTAKRPKNGLILTDNYPTPRGVAYDLMHEWNLAEYLVSGSIGLKICLVASGKADLFIKDVPVRDWDVAAPQLVLEEAGGCMATSNGGDFAYAGSFEHTGLIACASRELAKSAVTWFSKRKLS